MRTRGLLLSLGLAVAIALESTVVTAQGGAPSHEELARAAVQRVLGRGAPETVQVYGEWFAQKNTRTVTQSQNLRATVQRVLGRGTPETVQVYSEIAPKKTRTETQSPSLKRPGRPWTTVSCPPLAPRVPSPTHTTRQTPYVIVCSQTVGCRGCIDRRAIPILAGPARQNRMAKWTCTTCSRVYLGMTSCRRRGLRFTQVRKPNNSE
jgi:hypothetical protein